MKYNPSYVKLSKEDFQKRIESLRSMMERCVICPHCCGVNRLKGEIGFCKARDKVKISSCFPHFGEEDVLVGRHGSGTIFFSYCNLRCVFCQNYTLSQGIEGREVSTEELAMMMLKLKEQGCHNINLVSPSHYVPQIVEAISMAASEGLNIPIVYNTGGYDSVAILKLLQDIIDIYMPDTKYMDEELGKKYSKIGNYPRVLKAGLKEMHRQVGDLEIKDGLAVKGLLVRHLILPNRLAGTKELLQFISEEISTNTYINLMGQYYPTHEVYKYPELTRRATREEVREAFEYAETLGLDRVI